MRIPATLLLFLLLPLATAIPHDLHVSFSSPESRLSSSTSMLTITDDAIYNIGYYSVDSADWQSFSFSGNAYENSDSWLSGTASASLPAALQGAGEHYIIVYSCSWKDAWDCHSSQGSPNGYWQLHIINNMLPEGTLYLVQDGVALADIVVSPQAPNMVKLAAEYFQSDVEAMSGATLPIRNDPEDDYDFHVYIGQSNYTNTLGITAEGTRDGGYKVISGEDYLLLLGDDEPFEDLSMTDQEWDVITAPDYSVNSYVGSRAYHHRKDIWELDGKGSMNAVHDFLRGQGMRWYYPSEIGTITPVKQDIAFQPLNELVNPDFPMRSFFLYYKQFGHHAENHYPEGSPYGHTEDHLKWILSLGGTSTGEYVGGSFVHGLNRVTGRLETKQAHPEYYAIWDGNLMNGLDGHGMKQDLCSEELLQATIRYVKTMIDTYELSSVGIMPADGFTSASESSQECLDMATPGRDSGEISDYVWEFINKVAWTIHDDPDYGPNKTIVAGAYSTYQLPPLELSDPRGIAPNIAILLTKWRAWTADPEQKQHFQDLTQEWIDILPSGKVYTYDYYLSNRGESTTAAYPAFLPHLIDEDLKFLKGKSGGEFIEIYTNWPADGYGWDTFAANGLNTYVTARLYWNADQDVDALLDEYYGLYYGPAAAKMQELTEYSEANIHLAATDPRTLVYIRELAQEALAIAEQDPEPVYAERVDVLLGMINSYYEGEDVAIDSCRDLTSASTTYLLTQDVSAGGDCFLLDADGVTLDCQGYTITYSTDGIRADDHAISVIESWPTYTNRGDYFTIRNCVIKDGSYDVGNRTGSAIYTSAADYGIIENVTINVSGAGIINMGGVRMTYRGNTVYAGTDNAFFMQYGSYNSLGPISNNLFEDNLFVSVSGNGAYFYRPNNDTIIGNTFRSVSNSALNLFRPINLTLEGNEEISG